MTVAAEPVITGRTAPALPPADAPGLALPDEVLQKLYHDNAIRLLARVGASFGGWG